MTKKVLVISTQGDEHIKLVSDLTSLEFVLFDPTAFVDNLERLSFYIDKNGNIQGMFGNHNLNDFQIFWYRKPKFVREDEYPVAENLQEHCRDNYFRFMNTLFSVYKDKFWLNHPDLNKQAEIKLKQFLVAKSIGFNISETLISNSATDVLNFIANKQTVVCKTLSQNRVKLGDRYSNGPLTEIGSTEKVKGDIIEMEMGLRINPHIFQEYSHGIVHRVIAINRQIFSIKTVPLKPEELFDSRAIMMSDDYSVNMISEIPDSLKEMCFKYLDHFGIIYGAFDFIETPNGEFLFLECNPNGQWGFVDLLAGNNNIATAFARLFESV